MIKIIIVNSEMEHNVKVIMLGLIKNLVLHPSFMIVLEQIGEIKDMRMKVLDLLLLFYHK